MPGITSDFDLSHGIVSLPTFLLLSNEVLKNNFKSIPIGKYKISLKDKSNVNIFKRKLNNRLSDFNVLYQLNDSEEVDKIIQ
jgi:hypothetical protein